MKTDASQGERIRLRGVFCCVILNLGLRQLGRPERQAKL